MSKQNRKLWHPPSPTRITGDGRQNSSECRLPLVALSATQESMDLVGDHPNDKFSSFFLICSCQTVSWLQNIVTVYSPSLVEAVPDNTWEIEEERHTNQNERYPPVVWDIMLFTIFIYFGYRFIIWKIISVFHPAKRVCISSMTVCEVLRNPARDRWTYIDLYSNQCGKWQENHHSVPTTNTITEWVISLGWYIWRRSKYTQNCFHICGVVAYRLSRIAEVLCCVVLPCEVIDDVNM